MFIQCEEVVVSSHLSVETSKCLEERLDSQTFINSSTSANNDIVRYIRRIIKYASTIYTEAQRIADVKELPWVSSALSTASIQALIGLKKYLGEFGLSEALFHPNVTIIGDTNDANDNENASFFHLDGVTIRDLDIITAHDVATEFKNQDKKKSKGYGSLFWLVDNCKSSYGRRMLKSWVTCPLLRKEDIIARQDLITWMAENKQEREYKAFYQCCIDIFQKFADVEKVLASLQFQRISITRMRTLLQLGKKISNLHTFSGLSSPLLLRKWLNEVDWQSIAVYTEQFDSMLVSSEDGPASNSLTGIFTEETEKSMSNIQALSKEMEVSQKKLDIALDKARNILKVPTLQFVTLRSGAVAKIEHLIELPATFSKPIPDNWIKISSTKQVMRFHTPEVLDAQNMLYKVRDEIKIAGERAWQQFIIDVKEKLHSPLRAAVQALANIDVSMSLAVVSKYPGYVRPVYPDGSHEVNVQGGRHPMLGRILEESGNAFVPNDVLLRGNFSSRCCQVVTGPNMGGKSSYVRMIALISLLGQIGSYVPAEFASLCIFDNIFTRMGAEDDLSSGRSTFMCELVRTANILHLATSKSLVIIDELGRGTSTHDGCAIALATLRYIVNKIGCVTLFITHFPEVARYVESVANEGKCCNAHMSFVEIPTTDSSAEIVFLYKVVSMD
jgi:DNA mismatch repair protein MSH3